MEKKDNFIRDYINDHFVDRLKKEMQLDKYVMEGNASRNNRTFTASKLVEDNDIIAIEIGTTTM
ncbi:hypothetical protein ASG97_24245 [Bacillus sp. Soil745]|nr:hypothetical protein ASG97_24245 [Bacillus sp. Soil745]